MICIRRIDEQVDLRLRENMCSNILSIAGSALSGPRPRSQSPFHLDFTTNAVLISEMSSASVSRNASIHFWRLVEITVALYWCRATVRVWDR